MVQKITKCEYPDPEVKCHSEATHVHRESGLTVCSGHADALEAIDRERNLKGSEVENDHNEIEGNDPAESGDSAPAPSVPDGAVDENRGNELVPPTQLPASLGPVQIDPFRGDLAGLGFNTQS